MKVREDDVWVVTYPKCGTTWTQEILWNIVNGVQVERIKEPIRGRSPFLDIPMLEDSPDRNPVEFFNNIDKMPSPRVIKVKQIFISEMSRNYFHRPTTPSRCSRPSFWRLVKSSLSAEMLR